MKKKEETKKINERYVEKLEKHIEQSKDASKYSIERFDILVISLSTTALVLSIGFVKNILPNLKDIDTSCLKFSWLLFTSTLILNLMSQVTGYYSNENGIKISTNLVREERGKKLKGNQKRYEKIEKILNNTTMILNGICLISLITGVIILIIFLSQNI